MQPSHNIERNVKYDYLKYFRVIRHYFMVKYSISQSELDMLLFLYSEKYFTFSRFKEYENLMDWNKKRFEKMLEDGWIVYFRKGNEAIGQHPIYEVSHKTKKMITCLYNMLNREDVDINTNPTKSKLFRKNIRYTDKVYRNFIYKINKERKQLRRRSRE